MLPSQAYKFTARLQSVQSCDRPALLRVYPTGGHDGGYQGGDAEGYVAEIADLLAFGAAHTGLEPGAAP